MYEVEAKVRLSKKDFERIRKELPKHAKRSGIEVNKDIYFSGTKSYFLRLREKNGQGLLNLKSKKRGEGIESNQEIELNLTSGEKFKSWLKKIGIKKGIQKTKKSIVYKKRGVRFELNEVDELGHFLEIEIISEDKEGIPRAKKELIEWFSKFGFSQKDFETKYYLELLTEIRKNR